MAKLSAHGTELFRGEALNCRVAYMSDGKILRDAGSGWKLWKRFKPGVDVPAAVAKVRAHYEQPTPDRYHRAELRKRFVAMFPGLDNRIRAFCAFDLLGTDIDGIWSELNDAGLDLSLDDVKELREAWICAEQEGNDAAARKLRAQQDQQAATATPVAA